MKGRDSITREGRKRSEGLKIINEERKNIYR